MLGTSGNNGSDAPVSLDSDAVQPALEDVSGVDGLASATNALLERINASGRLFVSHTKLRDRYGIRVAIGNGATEWRHVEAILGFL